MAAEISKDLDSQEWGLQDHFPTGIIEACVAYIAWYPLAIYALTISIVQKVVWCLRCSKYYVKNNK